MDRTSKIFSSVSRGAEDRLRTPSPDFEVTLVRSLQTLARVPRLASLFTSEVANELVPAEGARVLPLVVWRDFLVAPVLVTDGWRNVPAPIINEEAIKRYVGPYMDQGLRVVMGEACRNIGQHACRESGAIGAGRARFAPGAVFLRELVSRDPSRGSQRVLVCMVADEGSGIAEPSLSILDGVGSSSGADRHGMGIEIRRSLVSIVKSRDGRWFVYDGLNHTPISMEESLRNQHRQPPPSKWVKPISELSLPKGRSGCRKIFLFAHPDTDRATISSTILGTLSNHEKLKRR